MSLFASLSAFWAIATLTLFILMLRISYKVERTSDPESFQRWPLRYANPIGVALNIKVAGDPVTQGLRRKLLAYMAAIGVLFVAFAVFTVTQGPGF